MPIANNNEKVIDQLRAEAKIERIKVSIACKELIQYCQDHQEKDTLIQGLKNIPNPWNPKTPCVIV